MEFELNPIHQRWECVLEWPSRVSVGGAASSDNPISIANVFAYTADVLPRRVTWRGRKLKNIIPQRYRSQAVRQFGAAKLIHQPNGQHELVGGADADHADAFEWSPLFAHEIVFTHFYHERTTHPRKPWFASWLQPAL